ncbi:MAG: ribonuclease H-like domain-containing protein [Candidatus Marinimicrobia bacterium]|nr:ribonuclease H-like domain-containing protein [Candidatus Neomarinimicrobiota bacterium]
MSKLKDRLNKIYNKEKNKNGNKNNIRKQLNRLYRNREQIVESKPKSQPDLQKLIKKLNGKKISSGDKNIIKVSKKYDMHVSYGQINLRTIYNYTQKDYQQYFNVDNIKYPEQLLFIDTETTGLSGGTGTIAFMVGMGWIDREVLHTTQFFLPEFRSEELMLKTIKNKIKGFSSLVSYNGKSFDIPLLTSRYLLNRLDPIVEELPHIDLLHPNRALWRYSSDNCKLQTIEGERFGFYRENDIPGELIPSVYFNYLNNRGNIEKVIDIFKHNRLDIISMLANLVCLFKAFKQKTPSENPLEDYAKGRHFKRRKKIKRSIRHYQNVLESDITENRRYRTLMELAAVFKKEKEYEEALPLWTQAAKLDFSAVSPLIELAKYYEHRSKEFEKALRWTQQALEIVDEEDVVTIQELEKRLKRVNKKLKRAKSNE